MRVWLKIILGTLHHRSSSISFDYINTNQKCIIYCLHKGLKLNLHSLLFKYLSDYVRDTRNNMKPRNYIPLGRLIFDILIESGLVDHLISLNLMEDIIVDLRKPLNGRNLKSMGLIDKVRVKPTITTSWEALKDHREREHMICISYQRQILQKSLLTTCRIWKPKELTSLVSAWTDSQINPQLPEEKEGAISEEEESQVGRFFSDSELASASELFITK